MRSRGTLYPLAGRHCYISGHAQSPLSTQPRRSKARFRFSEAVVHEVGVPTAERPFRSVSANAALLESGRHTDTTLSPTMGAILGIRMTARIRITFVDHFALRNWSAQTAKSAQTTQGVLQTSLTVPPAYSGSFPWSRCASPLVRRSG